MKKEIVFKEQSQEWLDFRKTLITGTDIPSLFGMNPYKSANKLKKEKFEGHEDVFHGNLHTRRGNLLEPAHVTALRHEGFDADLAAPFGYVKYVLHEGGMFGCSMDNIIRDGETVIPVESKTPGDKKWRELGKKGAKRAYYLQAYTQSLSMNAPYSLLTILHPVDPFNIVVYKIDRSEEIDKLIMDTVVRFSKEKMEYITDKKDSAALTAAMNNAITVILETNHAY